MTDKRRGDRKPGENPGHGAGNLVPQKHGGALRRGSQPGGTPGPGRPPSAIRIDLRAAFDASRPVLEAIVKSRKARHADRIRAADVLGKYAMSSATISTDDVRACLSQQAEAIREALPTEQAEQLILRIRGIWMGGV